MDVIRHETIGPNFDTVSDAMLGEQVSVESVVVFLNKDLQRPIATAPPM